MSSGLDVLAARIRELYRRVKTLEQSPQSGLWRRKTNELVANESTGSTSFTDLATLGPQVVVDVPASGTVVIAWSCWADMASGDEGIMTLDFSGANVIAASNSFVARAKGPFSATVSRERLLVGLSPGSTTITAKYRAVTGTPHFSDRVLAVIPI